MATTVTLKPNAIDLSGSTSGTTTLQATAVAGTTTITLPAATDTLVGKATTDTLTNKTLTTPVISTISNTGTLTLPTSTDTLVGRATTDTLTNKTLTTPVISSLSSASATALTLQSAGTTALTLDTSQNLAFNSGYGSVATAYGCRAWVNFNGTGTIAIRASGNVSSLTDNGTGDYTVNFTTSMPDANYTAVGNCSTDNSFSVQFVSMFNSAVSNINVAPTTSAFRLSTRESSGNGRDETYVIASVFR